MPSKDEAANKKTRTYAYETEMAVLTHCAECVSKMLCFPQ
jgi:hypothetical protein